MGSYSEALAGFVDQLHLDRIPREVEGKTKLIILDTLGIALASSTMDFGRMVTEVSKSLGGPQKSRIIGAPWRVAAANAALANGTLAHGLDYDDTLEEAVVHTGCCIVTTAMAVGEEMGSTGQQLLEAVVAGIEAMGKIGLAVPGKFPARGFHSTGLCGTFGAAAAAGKLYGLSISQMMDSFGICGSQSSGILECLTDGTWTKRLHAGWSAHGGVIAALLAAQGFRAPRSVFEGRHGLYRAFAGEPGERLKPLLESLGEAWEILRITFKTYPCGSISHPYMDCALRLRQVHGVMAEDIVEVRCRTAEGVVPILWEPLAEKRRPSTSYGSKFSLPYSIAVMLVRGKAGLEEFSEEAVRDPHVLALAAKVGYEVDPSLDFPRHFSGHVKVILKDGKILEESQPHPRGGLEIPLPPEEIIAKFRDNARMALSAEKVERIVEAVENLERLSTITELADLLF
jgi:2-methylcitrate dehydratase PrpD